MSEPHALFIAMARDWTDTVVVRDAPERAADVVRQCVERLEAAESALTAFRALSQRWREKASSNGAIYASGIEECADDLDAVLVSLSAPVKDE